MKKVEKDLAIKLRIDGYSINEIVARLGVAKSSVSIWVRNVELSDEQKEVLIQKGHYREVVEKRRLSRLQNEAAKREVVIQKAAKEVEKLSTEKLKLIGTALYWAEGGKTQRMVRFSNGDPEMIKLMMVYFDRVCKVTPEKFRGHIHIHPHLDYRAAERYWSEVSGIHITQFYKTYRKPNKSSQNKKDSLPNGVFDIYILDTKLFLTILGWTRGITNSY